MSLKTFFKIGEANAEYARVSTELTTLQASFETAKTEHANALQALQGKLTTAEGQVASLTTERDTARTEATTARAELATAQARVTELEGKQTTVEQRAAEVAATVGTPTAVKPDGTKGDSKTKEQLWTEYHALPIGEAQNAFYKKNRAQMRD